MNWTKWAEQRRGLVDTAFRGLASLIFVTAGFAHVVRPDGVVARLEASAIGAVMANLAPAKLLVVATGVVLLIGGIALLLGAGTRLAALALLACLVPITISVQLEPGQLGPLFKNVALFGMLLHFASAGSAHHAFSLDAMWHRRHPRRGAATGAGDGVRNVDKLPNAPRSLLRNPSSLWSLPSPRSHRGLDANSNCWACASRVRPPTLPCPGTTRTADGYRAPTRSTNSGHSARARRA